MPLLLYIFDKLCDQDTFLAKFSSVNQHAFILIEKTNVNIVLFTIKLGFYKTALSSNELKIFQFRAQMQRPIQSANKHRNSQGRRHAWVLGFFPGRSHLII